MQSETAISRELMGKIVDEVFDGAIEDASVIEEIYAVIRREEAALSAAEPVKTAPAVSEWKREHDALGELIRLLDEEPSIGDAEMSAALEKARCVWDHSHAPQENVLGTDPTLWVSPVDLRAWRRSKAGEIWAWSENLEGQCVPLYAAPPAPSVAVKAIEAVWKYSLVIESSVRRGDGPDQYAGVTEALRLVKEARSALCAQVQDESEIVDCLLAGKPFVFDPATNFCHADDGGAPEHGIKYVPAAQVQDVADTETYYTTHNNWENMCFGGGITRKKMDVIWDFAAQSWANADVELTVTAAPAKQEG